MNQTSTIAWREYRAFFTSPVAYAYLAIFLVAVNWLFFRGFFIAGQADMRAMFEMLPWIYLIFVPCVTMGRWAEEKKQGTIELLLTMPVPDSRLVAGKFLACAALIATALALTLPAAFTVSLVGNMDWGPVIGGYAGALLLGCAYVSVGLAVSSLTESQIIAFVGTAAVCFVMLVIGTPLISGGQATPFTRLIAYMGLGTHFASMSRGVIDLRDVTYYLSFIGFFLYVNLKLLRVGR